MDTFQIWRGASVENNFFFNKAWVKCNVVTQKIASRKRQKYDFPLFFQVFTIPLAKIRQNKKNSDNSKTHANSNKFFGSLRFRITWVQLYMDMWETGNDKREIYTERMQNVEL